MTVDQLPEEAREFALRLGGLLARVDQDAGWAGVFWRRDPDGMRACVEGREVPPWDVVQALLQDVAAAYGARAAEQEAAWLRPLHAAALVAHDDRPGGRDALGDRLDVMLREQRYAAERQAELGRLLAAATTPEETEALRLDLAWAHDDHARAAARCAELRRRMAQWDDRAREHTAWRTDPGRTAPAHPAAPSAASGPRHPAYGAGTDGPVDAPDFTGFLARGDATGPTGPAGPGDPAAAADFAGPAHPRDVTAPRGPADRGGPVGRAGFNGPAGPGDPTGPTGRADRSGPARPAADVTATADLADRTGRSRPPDTVAGADWATPGGYGATEADWAAGGGYRATGTDRPGAGGHAASGNDPSSVGGHVARGTDRPGAARHAAAEAGRGAAHEYGVTAADRPAAGGPAFTGSDRTSVDGDPDADRRGAGRSPHPHPDGPYGTPIDPHPGPVEPPTPTVPKQRKRRRGSARFAGMAEDAALAVPAQADGDSALPGLGPAPVPAGRRALRGARFAGAAAEPEAPAPGPPETGPLDDRARQEAAEAVERLVALRARGLSGEAHALLVELAYWPAARVPLLAAELQHAGLGADWATLLWEAASLPVERLVAAADALLAAGRADDAERILRQGVGRPAEEMGEAVRDLAAQGRHREVRALLDAYVRVRAPEEAARSAAPDPRTLVPLLLEAARDVSDARYLDLVHALRVAGHHT
ncbi:hypothetical protein ABZ733_15860 [Streptomyces longwoodensis]|uniref:hypothetical protein n=1 Tax=Streptomyces longwoodensis TaxID=68231 RepID=UPI00340C8281